MNHRRNRMNHEEWSDLRSVWERPEPPRMTARIVIAIALILAVMALIWIALARLITPEIVAFVAPTAAEVMADGFDLEAKLAEVRP